MYCGVTQLPIGDCRLPNGRRMGGSSIVIPAKRNASRNPGVHWRSFWLVGFGLILGIFSEVAFSQSQLPEAVRNVGIDQRLNEQLPLDIECRNEDGRLVTL